MIKIEKGDNQTYQFSLKTESGSTILKSIPYGSKGKIRTVVSSLNPSLKESLFSFERKTDHNGKFLFNLKDRKGNIIGNSQLYGSEAGMENGIQNTRDSLANIPNWEQL